MSRDRKGSNTICLVKCPLRIRGAKGITIDLDGTDEAPLAMRDLVAQPVRVAPDLVDMRGQLAQPVRVPLLEA